MKYLRDSPRFVIGSETQSQECAEFVTGIQRVVCETHKGLVDLLGLEGIAIGWTHTAGLPRSTVFQSLPYLAEDPILSGEEVQLAEIDALIVLDLPNQIDFRAIIKAKSDKNIKTFFLVYDIIPLIHPEFFTPKSVRSFKLYLQQLLHVADFIIVTSDQVRKDIESLGWKYAAQVRVVPLGSVHQQRAPGNSNGDRISALCVNTIEPRKGHNRLLDAFDFLRKQGSDVDLTLIGRIGWNCDVLVERITNHPDFNGRLKWLADADDNAVVRIAANCNVAVAPTEAEGFGLFVEEALTLGLKVVVSDIPVFRERNYPNTYFAELTGESLARTMLNAARADWVPVRSVEIRTMRDFSRDVADLILENLLR